MKCINCGNELPENAKYSPFECQNSYGVVETHYLEVVAKVTENGAKINPIEVCVDGEMVNLN